MITTERSDPVRRAELRWQGVRVEVVAEPAGRVDLADALAALRAAGIESVLVEGGADVITALLAAGLVDRIIVGIAPIVIGAGTEAVNALGVDSVAEGIRLENRSIVPVGDDVVLAWDVVRRASGLRAREAPRRPPASRRQAPARSRGRRT